MRTAHEVAISQQLGDTIPAGRYAAYDRNEVNAGEVHADCPGWTSSASNEYGSATTGGAGGNQRPSVGACNGTGQPMLCCD